MPRGKFGMHAFEQARISVNEEARRFWPRAFLRK
jgi:hypothetical protein